MKTKGSRASMSKSTHSGLDLLLHACERDVDGFQIQTIDELKRETTKKKRTATKKEENEANKKQKVDAMTTIAEMAENAMNKMNTSGKETQGRRLVGGEIASVAEDLAREHPEIVLERAKQWLELVVGDIRARLAALKRSRRRTQKAWMKYSEETCPNEQTTSKAEDESESGVRLLHDFDRALSAEQRGLERSLEQWEILRQRADSEASMLARGATVVTIKGETAKREAREASDFKSECCSTAYAFLRTAVGVYLSGTQTPVKPSSAEGTLQTPNNVLDASRLFSPLT